MCDFVSHKLLLYVCVCVYRLFDVLHSEKKLTLVFEYCDQV